MKQYECSECPNRHCVSENTQNDHPTNCVFGMSYCNWHKAEANKKPSQLPKLTEEIFKHPEWPKEYIYAAVNKNGTVSGFMHSPKISGNWWADQSSARPIPYPLDHLGKFDNTDWEHSVVALKLPAEKRLPNWCKIGAWVWHKPHNAFAKITSITENYVEWKYIPPVQYGNGTVQSTAGNIRYMAEDLSHAYVRPWTFEEAPVLLKVRNRNGEFDILYLEYQSADDGADQFMYFSQRNEEDLVLGTVAEEFIQLDGSPCGVLEVRNSIQEKE